MTEKVIFKNVSKFYNTNAKKSDILLSLFTNRKSNQNRIFKALNKVSFTAYEGETIGILGLNGSGKSTLSNLIAQIISPSEGEITINGTPSLIAISAGLNNNLTGIENIELKCMMLGLSSQQIDNIKDDIINFSELGEYINQPVKNYSSGMRSRLGFAISVHTDPDILIIDEALSVGDATFAEKSLNKINGFKERGKTIFFVSHSASQMRAFCDRIIWIHHGEIMDIGDTKTIIKKYEEFTKNLKSLTSNEKEKFKEKYFKNQYDYLEETTKGSKRNMSNRIATFLMILPLLILIYFIVSV